MHATIAQAPAPAAPASAPFSGLGGLMPIILMVAIFYFMMIRPQMRKDKERRKEIESIRAGARVSFSGGIFGVVEEVKETTFRVRIADGVSVEIARGAVNGMAPHGVQHP